MVGLIDGSLSTLAPIFSVALISHKPIYAFVAGLATSIGAGISMAFSEGLSDTGELTGRGNPFVRGGITGVGTLIGGILHSLPFLIPTYHAALVTASIVVVFELIALAVLRWKFFGTSFTSSLAAVSLAGAIVASRPARRERQLTLLGCSSPSATGSSATPASGFSSGSSAALGYSFECLTPGVRPAVSVAAGSSSILVLKTSGVSTSSR